MLAILLFGVLASTAKACSLDGIASLSVNGHKAAITTDKVTASSLAYWSSFSLLAAAPGDTLHYMEDMANVGLSIPKESTSLPFRWSFGDGSTVLGRTATHRYRHTGRYRLTVAYFWPSHHQWVEFDSAEQRIVPQGALLWTNLGYYAGNVFVAILRAIVWAVLAVIAAFLVLERVGSRAHRRQRVGARNAHARSSEGAGSASSSKRPTSSVR